MPATNVLIVQIRWKTIGSFAQRKLGSNIKKARTAWRINSIHLKVMGKI